eukprot:CAMPEP_0202443290 /NCGR_PEP_ID=MMETSP1360-20130828/2613_1 /ASSEMBLY_ACC=CAM_ASM_000848 /TAXON_ID=515479 /ORGANISM="Licmophora paradoxa, Strain CCMP2313" /LENGTH=145 /DNA_ID=CAMNT_0049058951 /DNA_START=1346 /DNA_END=1783 /DNA_ORIENTATION=-
MGGLGVFHQQQQNEIVLKKQHQRQKSVAISNSNDENILYRLWYQHEQDILTVILLTLVTGLAFWLRDVGFVLALNGATAGNALTYLFPTFMFLNCAVQQRKQQQNQNGSINSDTSFQRQIPLAVGTAILGLVMGIIGTSEAIRRS